MIELFLNALSDSKECLFIFDDVVENLGKDFHLIRD